MADKIPATGSWEDGSISNMVKTGPGAYASRDKADEIRTERRKARAKRKHHKQGHEDKVTQTAADRFLHGKNSGSVKRHESKKVQDQHIEELMNDSKRTKKYENQT